MCAGAHTSVPNEQDWSRPSHADGRSQRYIAREDRPAEQYLTFVVRCFRPTFPALREQLSGMNYSFTAATTYSPARRLNVASTSSGSPRK